MKNKSIFLSIESFLFKNKAKELIEYWNKTIEKCSNLILENTNQEKISRFSDRLNPLYGYSLCVYNHARSLYENGYYLDCFSLLKKTHFPFDEDTLEGVIGYEGEELIQSLESARWEEIAKRQRERGTA